MLQLVAQAPGASREKSEPRPDKVQLGLTPHRDDPGTWEGTQEILGESGISIVSGMFSTIGEDYTTPETIRVTGGVVPDEHWQRNRETAEAAAALASEMGLKLVTTHAGFLPHEPSDPDFDKLCGRIVEIAQFYAQIGGFLLLETGQESAIRSNSSASWPNGARAT